jgi:type VI secretion system secreted protein VgrG
VAEPITQQNRDLKVYTPLAFDVLLIDGLSGREGISRPFSFTLKLLAEVVTGMPQKVSADKLLGKPMSVELVLTEGKSRFFNGIVESFSKEGQDDQFVYYRAELVPWFSLLDLKSNCRIFQDQTVPQIMQKILGELQLDRYFRPNLKKEYTKWDYCVQYRETDFNFLSRLLEDEGISYHFEHKDDHTHTLVLTDSTDGHDVCPQKSTFRYSNETGVGDFEDVIRSWDTSQAFLSGKWGLRDYHFEMPRNPLEVPEPSVHVTDENKDLEVFDYPGGYAKKFNKPELRLDQVRPEGEKVVRLQMEQEEAGYIVYDGTSDCPAMTSGYKFTVDGGTQVPSGPYLFTSIHHTAVQHPPYVTDQVVPGFYNNGFSCIPASVVFRPERATPKPIVHGPQTARVVDENPQDPKEEIWPDKYGRVRVRFPWDRKAEYACWIRVSQPWAGKMWGYQWIPRVGDEVVVTFLEGDPDCPLIVGSVYNADNMPPFALPDHKTQSGILTHSSPKGGSANFNMLRFEDKKGSEDLLIHAERTMHNSVEANQYITVGGDRHITTGSEDDDDNVTGGNVKEHTFANHNLRVEGDSRTDLVGKHNLFVGARSYSQYALTRYTTVLEDEVLNGKANITIQAQQTITLMAGSNSIVIGPSGITLIGLPMISLNPMGAVPPIFVPPPAPEPDKPDLP